MKKIAISLEAVNGGANYALLADKRDIFPYDSSGKRTSDTPIGVRLDMALQKAGLQQLAVKFPTDPLPKLTAEQIAAANAACRFLFVQIPDCLVTLYTTDRGGISMTATAETAKLVSIKGGAANEG